jgi:hypothetical protein
MADSYLTIITAILFVLMTTIITLSLFYVNRMKKNLINNKEEMLQISKDRDERKQIEENDRVQFITKCNRVDQALENLLAKQMVTSNHDHQQMLHEKRFYVKKIKDIVNDLAFTNKREFEQLNSVLKEIQKDVLDQNKRISHLESKVVQGDQTKNELANLLIQRMMNDSSKKTLRKTSILPLLQEDDGDKEDEVKRLEKYIIKTIRKQVDKELKNYPVQTQTMNPIANIELERKVELMDLVNHKLRSMENLYKNLHTSNKKQIISVMKQPVKQAIRPYLRPETIVIDMDSPKPKCNKKVQKVQRAQKEQDLDLKIVQNEGEANTFYVSN